MRSKVNAATTRLRKMKVNSAEPAADAVRQVIPGSFQRVDLEDGVRLLSERSSPDPRPDKLRSSHQRLDLLTDELPRSRRGDGLGH